MSNKECVSSLPKPTFVNFVFLCAPPQACREKHISGEGFMVYGVVCRGVTDCSNTLEDDEDAELLPQALVYKPCRQHIYGLLLLPGRDGSTANTNCSVHAFRP